MYKFKNSLIAFLGLAATMGLIALVTPTTGVGQSGKTPSPQDVRLVGTTVTQPVSASSPLPVQGSVTVANTPSVNVVGMPDLTGTVSINPNGNTVSVDTSAGPLAVADVNRRAQTPFHGTIFFSFSRGGLDHFTTEAGKTTVIRFLSAGIAVGSDLTLGDVYVLIEYPDESLEYITLPLVREPNRFGTDVDGYIANETTDIRLPGGSTLVFHASAGSGTLGHARLSLFGYTE